MIKKIASACTAALLGAALTVGGISTASAEELSLEETIPPVVIVEDSVVEETVVEEVVETVVPESIIEAAPVEEEAVAPAVQERTVAPLTVQKTKIVSWLTPYTGATAPSADNPAIWPQVLYTTPVCGEGWIQTDNYKYHTKQEKQIVDWLVAKGTLKKINGTPEDSAVYISHVFTKQEACPPPVVIPNSLETSHTVGCVDGVATVTITLRNVSPWIYPVSVEIDGVHSYGPTVDNRTNGTLSGPQQDQSRTRTITFAEDSGDHTVRYRVDAGSENSLYRGLPVGEWTEITVNTDCQVNVPPAPEVETDFKFESTTDCESRTVSTQEFERYTLEPVYDEESNRWTQGEWSEWTAYGEPVVREATEEECPIEVPPTEEPPVVVPPTDLPPTDVPPTTEVPETVTPADTPQGTLPFTGTNPIPLIGGGSLLLLLGTAALSLARRNASAADLL